MRPLSLCCANCIASLFVLSTESTDNFVSSKCFLALCIVWVFCFCGSPCPSVIYVLLEEYQEAKNKLVEAAQSPGVPMHEHDG